MRLAEIDGKPCCAAGGLAVPRPAAAGRSAGRGRAVGRAHPQGAGAGGGRGERGLVRRLAGLHARRDAEGHRRRPGRRRRAAAARGGAGDRARDLCGGPHRRHAPDARAVGRAAGRRGRRADGCAGADPGRGRNDPRRSLSAAREAVSPDLAARLARYCARLPEASRVDPELLEINPLVLTADGRLGSPATPSSFATTARTHAMTRWNSRSAGGGENAMSPLEREARTLGFHWSRPTATSRWSPPAPGSA